MHTIYYNKLFSSIAEIIFLKYFHHQIGKTNKMKDVFQQIYMFPRKQYR